MRDVLRQMANPSWMLSELLSIVMHDSYEDELPYKKADIKYDIDKRLDIS